MTADEFDEALIHCCERAWMRAEFPAIAKWIDLNEKAIQRILNASRRSRLFFPQIRGQPIKSGYRTAGREPFAPNARECFRIFAARAMLNLGEGKLIQSQEDLLAGRRIVRLFAQPKSMLWHLIALSGTASIHQGEFELSRSAKLTGVALLKYQQIVREAIPAVSLVDTFHFAERYELLNRVLELARGFDRWLDVKGDKHSERDKQRHNHRERRLRLSLIDWNDVLRFSNEGIDEVVAILRSTDESEQRKKLKALASKVKSLELPEEELQRIVKKRIATRHDRQCATDGCKYLVFSGYPVAVEQTLKEHKRLRVRHDLTILSLGLAAYRADKGMYPAKLSQLLPKYARQIPNDRYTGKLLIYKRSKNGFLLYSVGENGKDDGGRGYEDSDTDTDDFAVRIPPWPKPKPVDDNQ